MFDHECDDHRHPDNTLPLPLLMANQASLDSHAGVQKWVDKCKRVMLPCDRDVIRKETNHLKNTE